MRNYIDPEMNIAMFEAESVVVTNSTKTQAQEFFNSDDAGISSGKSFITKAVAAGNIIDFTD